jgi:hypothetical protein
MEQTAFHPLIAGRQALRSLRHRLRDPRTAEATAQALQNLDAELQSLECDAFLKEYEAAYSELRKDPEAWAEVEAERRAFDGTLMDGLGRDA